MHNKNGVPCEPEILVNIPIDNLGFFRWQRLLLKVIWLIIMAEYYLHNDVVTLLKKMISWMFYCRSYLRRYSVLKDRIHVVYYRFLSLIFDSFLTWRLVSRVSFTALNLSLKAFAEYLFPSREPLSTQRFS